MFNKNALEEKYFNYKIYDFFLFDQIKHQKRFMMQLDVVGKTTVLIVLKDYESYFYNFNII